MRAQAAASGSDEPIELARATKTYESDSRRKNW